MIAEIDELLRAILKQEIGIGDNDIDILFHQPTREWSARLSRPTLNLFLFDIRENWALRTAEVYDTRRLADGEVEIRRNPVRIDLRYLITAWVKEPEDEHLLLSAALLALLRYPFAPQRLLPPGLKDQPAPIPLTVASYPDRHGPEDKLSEIWGVLDNELRPSLLLTVTIAIDPYQPLHAPQVRTRELRFLQQNALAQPAAAGMEAAPSKTYWSIAGRIISHRHAPTSLVVRLVERGLRSEVDEEGRFSFSRLEEGVYTLDVLRNEKVLKRRQITVPSEQYDLEL